MVRQMKVLILLLTIAIFSPAPATSSEYMGARECYACHKDIKKLYLADTHGRIFSVNPRTELEKRGCEACHGPGSDHKDAADRADNGENVPLAIKNTFKKDIEGASSINAVCLKCHDEGTTLLWQGSEHEMEDMSCTDCHHIHAKEKIDGTDSCITCHVQKRAQIQRSSHMPIREGKLKCSDCHNPHGSASLKLLRQPSINENCYSCHAEKRGPLLWEHDPVRENCSTCHDSHGSNQASLLKMRAPYLCQSCHSSALHPSTFYDGTERTSKSGFLLGKACLNCHSLIHGSNHPSGSGFTR